MILCWKAVALDCFRAEWQGMTLLLTKDDQVWWSLTVTVSVPGTVLEVNGLSVWSAKQRWHTARKGMEVVDTTLTKLIMRRARQSNIVINRLRETPRRMVLADA